MASLWQDPTPALDTSEPTLDTPARRDGSPETRPETWRADAQTVSPEIRGLVVGNLTETYSPEWQPPYGTTVGRSLTGATPDEALPVAPGREATRESLLGVLNSRHPETEAVLRGALADTMPRDSRAVVNEAALDAVVARDPEALLDFPPDIPRDQLVAWRALAGKTLPTVVTDRMDAMNGSIMDRFQQRLQRSAHEVSAPALWSPLDVRNASGGVVNMDYYPVRVRLPAGTDPGVLLNQIRTNLDRFVDTSKSSFRPYPDQTGNADNVARWNSTNPTGSFVTIDIPVNDGTVAVIDSSTDHWTFATVKSPADGLHPVSGNREFGYTGNGDGTYTFYTRGVDRITDPGSQAANWVSRIAGGPGVAFSKADQLWQSFQNEVAHYVREQGGRAVVEDRISVQPDWDRVGDVLTGRESVRSFVNRDSP